MKKLDLHIHTKSTISDAHFNFSITKLIQYVKEMKIDAIAITNHNLFDLSQYQEIREKLFGICEVFPGIEINVGVNGFGHLICISAPDDLHDFAEICEAVQEKINSKEDKISLEELKLIIKDFSKYLLIPHYEKEPNVEKDILTALKEYILVERWGV